MRRCAYAVKKTGGREDEHAGTDRHQPRAAIVRAAERAQNRPGWQLVRIAPAWNDDRVGSPQRAEAGAGDQANAARRAQRTCVVRTRREAVPVDRQLRTRQPKDFDGHRELERGETVVGEGDDPMGGWHGRILTHIVISAYSLASVCPATWTR